MLQLTYTSCRPGMSLDGSSGYTVRAASPGLEQHWRTYAPHLARYDVASVQNSRVETRRLAFQRRGMASVITHTLKVRDHDLRVATFTHAIIDPSGNLGPAAAIRMWGSQFWRCADTEGSTELPRLDVVPTDGTLSCDVLQQMLQENGFYALAQFLLGTWLCRADKAIVLMADAQKVAAAVWLLARCLPSATTEGLSFATRDHDPLTAGVMVVGCSDATRGISASERSGYHWFDLNTGNGSITPNSPCAKFICRAARNGDWATIDAYLSRCDALQAQDAVDLELLDQVMHQSHVCTSEEILQLQHRPRLLRWLLEDDRQAAVAISLLADVAIIRPDGAGILECLVTESAVRKEQLINCLISRAGESLAASDVARAERLAESCSRLVQAGDVLAIWESILAQVTLARLSVLTRIELADRLLAMGASTADHPVLKQLLDVPVAALPDILNSRVGAATKAEAYRLASGGTNSVPQAVTAALAHQFDVLRLLVRTSSDATAVASLMAENHPQVILELLVADQAFQDHIELDTLLDHVFVNAFVTYSQLASSAYCRYWHLLLKGRHADRFGTAILSNSGIDGPVSDLASALRRALAHTALQFPLACALKRRLALLDATRFPETAIGCPDDIITAVGELPDSQRRHAARGLLERLASSIASLDTSSVCSSLPSLLAFATTYTDRGADVPLRMFARTALANGRLLKDAALAVEIITHAFGAGGSKAVSNPTPEGLLRLGVELTSLYGRAGGPAFNHQIDQRTTGWPEPARTFLRLARQQRRINGRLWARLARSHVSISEPRP